MLRCLPVLVAFWFVVLTADALAQEFQSDALPALPDTEGFAGAYCGIVDGSLIVAGGANFPDLKPWQGGTKVWYDTIYSLPLHTRKAPSTGEKAEARWTMTARLPSRLGYGVSIQTEAGIACIGGSHEQGHEANVFLLKRHQRSWTCVPMGALPETRANHFGARMGHQMIVGGGQERPDSTSALESFLIFDGKTPEAGWKPLPAFPGPARILATACANDTSFWVIGGASLQPGPDGKPIRTYLRDVWKYSEANGWQQEDDLPFPLVASPSPTSWHQNGPLIFGGDDGSQVGFAPERHQGFRREILSYDGDRRTWTQVGRLPLGQVTTTVVAGEHSWLIPTGEIRPGIRTPTTTRIHW